MFLRLSHAVTFSLWLMWFCLSLDELCLSRHMVRNRFFLFVVRRMIFAAKTAKLFVINLQLSGVEPRLRSKIWNCHVQSLLIIFSVFWLFVRWCLYKSLTESMLLHRFSLHNRFAALYNFTTKGHYLPCNDKNLLIDCVIT